jgi:hypothetical protein
MYLDTTETNSPSMSCSPGVDRWQRFHIGPCERIALQTLDVQRRRTSRGRNQGMGQRTRMTKLRPNMGTVRRSDLGEPSEKRIVGTGPKNQISRLLRIAGIDLNLTDKRQSGTAVGPPPVKRHLFIGRIAGTVSKGIGHRCLDQPILENDSTRKLQRRAQDTCIRVIARRLNHYNPPYGACGPIIAPTTRPLKTETPASIDVGSPDHPWQHQPVPNLTSLAAFSALAFA